MNPQQVPRKSNSPSYAKAIRLDKQPSAIEAEMAVLGAVLIDNSLMREVSLKLCPQDFHAPVNRTIFRALVQLSDQAEKTSPIDYLTVLETVGRMAYANKAKPEPERIEVAEVEIDYLMELAERTPAVANVMFYAEQVKQKSLLRELIRVTSEIHSDCFDFAGPTKSLLESVEAKIHAVTRRKNAEFSSRPISDVFVEMIADWQKRESRGAGLCGLPTGFDEIDRYTAGLESGKLFVVAARPSHGKTSLAATMAVNMAVGGVPVYFATSEISRTELVELMSGIVASVNTKRIKRGDSSDYEYDRFKQTVEKIRGLKISIDDESKSVQAICANARAAAKRSENPAQVVFIDYLGRLEYANQNKSWTEAQRIGKMCLAFKNLSQELDLPVVLLAQLNREVSKPGAKHRKPTLTDLKGSGDIEQEADTVLLLHYGFKEGLDSPADEIDIILAKQRNGEIGDFKLRFRGEYRRFENMPIREPRPIVSNYQDVNDLPPTLSKP